MSRGRTDSDFTARETRQTGRRNFHGNSSIVARACDNFFHKRGMDPTGGGMKNIILNSVRGHRQKIGRCVRENKVDLIAESLEGSWQT